MSSDKNITRLNPLKCFLKECDNIIGQEFLNLSSKMLNQGRQALWICKPILFFSHGKQTVE